MHRLIVPLLLTAALAGCADAPAPPADVLDEHGRPVHTMHDVDIGGPAYASAQEVTGQFQPTDDALIQVVNGIAGIAPSNWHTYDVSDAFTVGDPTWVDIRVDQGGTNIISWLSASDFKAVWTSDCGDCLVAGAGTTWQGAVVKTDEALTLNVAYIGRQAQPTDYAVTFTAAHDPARVPSGIVLEVDLPASGSHVLFEGDGAMPDVMAFGPDDTYLGVLPGGSNAELRLGIDDPTGAYVFLPVGHGGFYKLRVGFDDGGTPSTRMLEQAISTTGPHGVTANTEFTFEHEVRPLQMGVAYFGTASQDATVILESPNGVRVTTGHTGLVAGGIGGFSQTAMGAPDLTEGTYTLSWQDTINDGSMSVQEFFTFYSR